MNSGPQLAGSDHLHAMKYRQPGETHRDAMNRVASTLADEGEYHVLREILSDMRFMPAGRVQRAIGTGKDVTPYNCFVSGTIPDSFVTQDNPEQSSIMHRALEAATTMRMGGGIGYDFSTLRPAGDLIRKLKSHSNGPLSFMEIFDATCRATASAGHRRGAQMGVLRVDHPDIVSFVNAKHDQHTLAGFNISVAVTDDFMEALETERPFQLKFDGRVYEEVDPLQLWESIMRSTWDWAEPGVLFIDQINRMNNLWYCERLAATNPCGEQPLPPFGACLLGSFNLARYLRRLDTGTWGLDWGQLEADIPHVVRAMDNVVDVAAYPLAAQAVEARSKRRMGLGVTGLANALEALGHPYGTPGFLDLEDRLLRFITRHCYIASARLAAEKGAFPLYDQERYLAGQFVQTLDDDVYELIQRHGIRNSHLTSIAPTGTISTCADNVSSSIEPVFSFEYDRPVNTPQGQQIFRMVDYGLAQLGVRGRPSSDVSAAEHVAVLATAQRHVDSAVSKTCNVPPSMDWKEFKEIYRDAYRQGCKGVTTFNSGGKRMALLTASTDEQRETQDQELALAGQACSVDPVTGERSCE